MVVSTCMSVKNIILRRLYGIIYTVKSITSKPEIFLRMSSKPEILLQHISEFTILSNQVKPEASKSWLLLHESLQ